VVFCSRQQTACLGQVQGFDLLVCLVLAASACNWGISEKQELPLWISLICLCFVTLLSCGILHLHCWQDYL
jgi:hypothetical protein